MKTFLKYIVVASLLYGCSPSESDLAGVYVKEPSIHTIDSLFIYADSLQPTKVHNRKVYKFKQRYYNKVTGELLFENINTWYLDGNDMNFMNLYLDIRGDEDPNDRSYSKERLKDVLMPCQLPVEGGKIVVNYDLGVRYVKVK